MNSDNPSGAENQQERPAFSHWLDAVPSDVGHYIAGFVEGEGSFNVPIVREYDRGLPWRVTLSFNVSQRGSETPLFLRETLGVGRVRGEATVSSITKSLVLIISPKGSFLSSRDSDFGGRRPRIFRSS
jgi:hypothetical protein